MAEGCAAEGLGERRSWGRAAKEIRRLGLEQMGDLCVYKELGELRVRAKWGQEKFSGAVETSRESAEEGTIFGIRGGRHLISETWKNRK